MIARDGFAYHYTIGSRVSSILADGVIDLATGRVPAHVKAAVWLTTSEDFEPTARKMDRQGRILTVDQMQREDGVYRIAVDAERFPLTWADYCRQSGDSRSMLRRLERCAVTQGSDIGSWRLSFAPIMEADWLRLERLAGGVWIVDWDACSERKAS